LPWSTWAMMAILRKLMGADSRNKNAARRGLPMRIGL